MGNLFAGLSTGNMAMTYYRRGIETAGHNIANAGTEGYARQRVNVSENIPVNDGGMLVGQGVNIDGITRLRDAFLDAQYRAQQPTLGYWETRVKNLTNLEYYCGEVDRGTFSTALDDFWTKMQGVHLYPNVSTYRTTLLSSANTMVQSLTNMRTQYDAFRSDLNDQVRDMVGEANDLIDEIALLCKEISAEQNRGGNPNDLLDRRDLLAERLCKLTGATVSSSALDEGDGDYKIDLNGKMLVQGGAQFNCDGSAIRNVRHLVLVPMVGNNNYFDVQVENNQYDHISDLNVASVVIERGTTNTTECSRNGIHELFVERLSNGMTWQVGGAKGVLEGGDRLDTIYDATAALGINGSFSLQVGNAGVKASSNSYAKTDGVILKEPAGDDPTLHEFRIAAGEFESTVSISYENEQWVVKSDDGIELGKSAGKELTAAELQRSLNNYGELSVTYDDSAKRFAIEAANTNDMRGHLLSITDIRGTLAQDMGIANKNPAVEITVTEEDSLQTIANKINGAYMSDLVSGDDPAYTTNPPKTAPSSPEEWLHANIITEPNGAMYIALTSNVAGEANRINVLPGSVCGANGDFTVARLLGFTDKGAGNSSYMQLDTDPNAQSTIIKDDVHVDDAYFIYNDRHYLSESNSFAEARIFKTTNEHGDVVRWDNPAADVSDRFAKGIRLNLNGLNRRYYDDGSLSGNEPTIITIRQHITNGSIYAMLENRDDTVLGYIDYLDKIAFELVTEVNAVHYSGHGDGENKGTTGTAFFKHLDGGMYGASKQIRVNSALAKETSLIAAARGDGTGKTRGEGDGGNALLLSQLKSANVFNAGSDDFNSYFLKFVSDLGMQGYTSSYMLETQQSVVEQIQSQRDSVMGVSSDEEMLDIIKFQQGVGAISRYMTALDDMLDRIINGMGRAGL